MIQRVRNNEDFWIADLEVLLDTPEGRDAAGRGTTKYWATESLLGARQAYQVPETAQRLKPGQKLGDAYVKTNLPVLRQRLYLASVGVAVVLNDAFKKR